MKYVFFAITGVVLGLLIAGLMYMSVRSPVGEPIVLLPSPTPKPLIVYVSGAVKRPGVYRLPMDSHIVDAIQQAGGFLIDAKIDQVNLADTVLDGAQITVPGGDTIPTPELTIGGNGLMFTPTPPAGQKVNINTASAEELDQLPGIGPTAAKKIVEYRIANGY